MNIWAVIKTGGKQYKVAEGDKIDIEKVNKDKDDYISFDEVLFLNHDNKLLLGQPVVKGAKVKAKVIEVLRDRKIRVVKFKPKSRYLRTQGHRQTKTKILIEKILI